MIKRQQLVDKFDLIVKQEIKNHNDAVLSTNISLEEVKEN